MDRPDRTFRFFVWLFQLGLFAVALWQRPTTPVGRRGKLLLRIGAAAIALVAVAAGILFAIATFGEGGDPWGRWVTAFFTFGLFGLPSSLVAIVVGAGIAHSGASRDAAHNLTAIFLAVAYFAQWLLLSVAMIRRSRF